MLIYISCPVIVPESTFKDLLSSLKNRYPNHQFTYWNRGTKYNSEMVKKADALAVILPNISFRYSLNSLPPGVLSEIDTADDCDIPLMVVYRTINTDNVFIYDAETINREFKGIAGTSSKYVPRNGTEEHAPVASFEYVGAIKQAWKNDYPTRTFDQRILLLV